MKIIKFNWIILCSFMFASNVNAGTFRGLIDRIQTKSNGYFIVFVTSAVNNECGSTMVLVEDPNSLGTNRIFSALLAYQAQEREVEFTINGCSGNVGLFSKIEDKG